MPRFLQNGYPPSSKQKTVTTVARGGTGASAADQAVTNLGGINIDTLDKPNGVAKLDSLGLLPTSILPNQITTGSTVNGPTSLTVNQVQAYTITNFNSFKVYDVQAISGSVSVSGDTITYTAPATEIPGGFTINGRKINITIIGIKPATPTITYPTFNSNGISTTASATASAFAMTTGSDTHASSDWQVATDSAFTNLVAQTIDDAINKTSWTFSPAVPNNATLYLRVRYKGTTYGYGSWSSTIIFSTGTVNNVTTEEAILIPPNGDALDAGLFGTSISIDGTGSRVAISQIGVLGVYVFVRSGANWTLEQKIIPTNATVADKFGYSISMDILGNRIAIGTPQSDISGTNTGAVFIYRRFGTWILEATLQASVPSPNDYFGYSVSISSNASRLVVGVPYRESGGTDRGAVYVFTRSSTTWTEEAILTASDGADNDYFGNSVAISGDGTRIVIGSVLNDSSGVTDSGAVYIFKLNVTWSQEIKLTASNKAINDNFGFSVAINNDGTRVVVGSYYSQPGSLYRAGSVYIYFRNGSDVWAQEAILTASDKAVNDQFGYSVSISDDSSQVLIGANNKTISGVIRGKVYLFTRSGTTWTQTVGFQGDVSPDVRGLGSSVSLARDKSRGSAGAINSYIGGIHSGSVSIYR